MSESSVDGDNEEWNLMQVIFEEREQEEESALIPAKNCQIFKTLNHKISIDLKENFE